MHATSLRAAVLAALATLALAGCERDAGDRTVGQKLDHAIDRTQQKLAEAGEKTQAALDKAGESVVNAGDKIAQKTEEAAVAGKDATGSGAGADGVVQTRKAVTDAGITRPRQNDQL